MNAVELDGVDLAIGGRAVLNGVSFAIRSGAFVGVLGPNGAGKTTLMRAILGLLPPRSGAIRVQGRAASRGDATIGYMPQSRAAISMGRLRGREMVGCALNGGRLGLPVLGAAGGAEVDRALDLVGATALAGRPVAELSGGERQRLLLAQALIGRPRLLLLDEPLSGLDPHRQREAVALVRSLQIELAITVLFSAHELNPLLGAMDQVLYLGGGHAALGTVDEVITAPVLSRLYGTQIDVVRAAGRIFVMAGEFPAERDHHHHA